MLNQEKEMNKHRILRSGMILLISTVVSCSEIEKKEAYYFESNRKNTEELQTIYREAKDTIQSWIDKKLIYYSNFSKEEHSIAEWQLDEIVYMNTNHNKCVLTMLIRTHYNYYQDDVYFILGEKLQGKWWFYDGEDLVILQENYTDNPRVSALPFCTLQKIARRNTLRWYYYEKPFGSCISKLFSKGYGSYSQCADEKYLINDDYFNKNYDLEVDRKHYLDFLKSGDK